MRKIKNHKDKGIIFLLIEPLKLETEEMLLMFWWILSSIGIGSSPIWLPALIRTITDGNQFDEKSFVLNGSLMAFLVIILVERLFNLYSIKIKKEGNVQVDNPGNEGRKIEDIEENSKTIKLISLGVGVIFILISVCIYVGICLYDTKINAVAQWLVFFLGIFLWYYIICLVINKRWEDFVNEGYSAKKDDDTRNRLVDTLTNEPTKLNTTQTGSKI